MGSGSFGPMERRRWRRRSAWGGGVAIGAGIVLFALFSDAGGACTANVVVLSDGVVGPHGCAATSIAYHAGIGLMVLGAALLVGACLLSVVGRSGQGVVPASAAGSERAPGEPEAAGDRMEPSRNGREPSEEPEPFVLPPGWYGNPENRNRSVQWWDGHRLVDRPPPSGG